MKNAGRRIITLIVLTSALLASALMFKFSPNSSWLAFVGWTIFFVVLQLPVSGSHHRLRAVARHGCHAWEKVTKAIKKVVIHYCPV